MQGCGGSNSEEEEEEEDDAEAALKKEVAQLKKTGKGAEKRFQALDSGANNVVFIRTHNVGKWGGGGGGKKQWATFICFLYITPGRLVYCTPSY